MPLCLSLAPWHGPSSSLYFLRRWGWRGHGRGSCLLIRGSALCQPVVGWGGVWRFGWVCEAIERKAAESHDSCWCQSVQISYGVWLGKKSSFYLSPMKKKKKKCLDFSFCTHSLFFYLKCAPCSFVPLISLVFNPSFFTRSRPRRPPLRTPDALRQCPWGRCPQWAGERSSAIYTPSPSCPTVLCVSAQREEKYNGC